MKEKFVDFCLEEEILKSLDFLNYKEPFEVQKKVLPYLMDKRNILVKAKTGSGKSASFGIPICNDIDKFDNKLRALIIVPTRELAIQVKEEMENIGRRKLVKCTAILGKEAFKEQVLELKQGINIIVATPGRIIDHISRNNVDLSDLEYFIIDEVDKMLTKGFKEDIDYIINKIPKDICRAFFSATVDEAMKKIISNYINDYEFIEVEDDLRLDDKITQRHIRVDYSKGVALKEILNILKPKSAIIFTNTKKAAEDLYQAIKDDFSAEVIHGDISQQRRFYIVDEFKTSKFNILISSDIIARGIHIDDVELVLNYDIPIDREVYIHRVGRTARAGKEGIAISLVLNSELEVLKAIEEYIGEAIEEISMEELGNIEIEGNSSKGKETSKCEIVKISIGIGKKKKVRIGDIVGALNNIDILNNEDIGVIKVYDNYSYVDILNDKGELLLENNKDILVKKKKAKIQRVL